ncbi:MAG: NAD/NADP octopine/nopaline dehydrogenase family protein [Burkholderiales bacterium]|nr:NAD/NADP octopine/nopaline dehydrogenase family protein [Burkholderiales bacterium]OJX04370.1 MAG: glycerol-3-phosphate dehydrogenase [Burkholderiales bacterium 70-64]
MKVTVLGGGHGGHAAAADFALQGHEVAFWRRDAAALAGLRTAPQLTWIDADGERQATLRLATSDLGEAMRDAELVVAAMPATAHEDLARALAPHLRDGQVVYLPPGTFGSYLIARRVREHGCTARVSFAETGTLPYLARKQGPSCVRVSATATNLPTGVFPASDMQRALAIIRQAYPCAHPVEDALSAALLNAGPVIHPPLILLNAGPLNRSRDFDIHNEGTQPVVRRVAERLDRERIATREALGYRSHHYPLRDHYEGRDWMYGPRSRSSLVESGDWREPVDLFSHRYMREDVALGLAFLVSVAGWAGCEVPVARALLEIAGALCDERFEDGERSLHRLGLARHGREQMSRLLQHGF